MNTLFHGSALVEIDPEGHGAVPAFLADALAGEGTELLVSRHQAETCLVGFGTGHLKLLAEREERRRLNDEARGEDARAHYHRMRRTFGLVDKMPRRDATFRIPAAMRHLGRIGALALFVGAGDSFEIWNPELAMESGDDQFRDLAAFQLTAHGAGDNTQGVN